MYQARSSQEKSILLAALAVGFAVFVAGGCGLFVIYRGGQESARESHGKRLLDLAKAAAALIDTEAHGHLKHPEQTLDPLYREVIEPLVRLHETRPEVYYLYTAVIRDGKTHFILDTAALPERVSHGRELQASQVMELFDDTDDVEANDAIRATLLAGGDFVSSRFVTDAFGTFLSAYTPLRARNGNIVGYVGVDMSADALMAELGSLRTSAKQSLAILFLGAVAAGAGTRHLLRSGSFKSLLENQNLVEDAERFRLLTDSGLDAFVDQTLPRGRLYSNERLAELLGFPSDETIRSLDEKLHPDDSHLLLDIGGFGEGAPAVPLDVRVRLLHRDGQWIPCQFRGLRLRKSDGRFHRVLGLVTDARYRALQENTLLEARAAAESGARAKGEFLTLVGHELRTPLVGVLGYANMLAGDHLSAEQKAGIRGIEQGAGNLLRMIDQILEYARVDLEPSLCAGWKPHALRDIAGTALRFIAPDASAKGLALSSRILDGVPEVVLLDAERTLQILSTLLSNAVKFTERGFVSLEIGTARNRDGQPTLRFAVRDTGPGIPEHARRNLFLPFGHADPTARRRHAGAGMGLAIADKLARSLQGSIEYESRSGQGSLFLLTLPLELADNTPQLAADPIQAGIERAHAQARAGA